MTGPILKAMDESGLRKSVKVVKCMPPVIARAGMPFLRGLGAKECEFAGPDGRIGTFSIQFGSSISMGKVTPEAIEEMMCKASTTFIKYEIEAVEKFRDVSGIHDVTLYICQDFEAHDDPTLIKRQKIGIFGWEEIGVAANSEKLNA